MCFWEYLDYFIVKSAPLGVLGFDCGEAFFQALGRVHLVHLVDVGAGDVGVGSLLRHSTT